MTKGILFALLLLVANATAQDATTAQTRAVRISFVPPPLEGKISLGIYDENDQLVRVLHEGADLDEFTAGADALVTKWDGKDDFGYDLWSGTYHARGFLVGRMKIEEITRAETAAPAEAQPIKIKLMSNPLEKSERPTIELVGGSDDDDALLKTPDGLPLLTITQLTDIKRVSLATDAENKSLIASVETQTSTRRFSISGVSKMMAFDCGEFELK
jgi:hypothetical protein